MSLEGAGTAEILVGSQGRGGRKWAPRVEPVATVTVIIIIVRIYTLGVPKKVVNRILRAVVHPLLQATLTCLEMKLMKLITYYLLQRRIKPMLFESIVLRK